MSTMKPVPLLLEGIPQNSREVDISKFFTGFDFLKGTIKLRIDESRKRPNMATILFKTEEEAEKAR